MKAPASTGSAGRALVGIGTLLVVGGLIAAIAGVVGTGLAAMGIVFVVFVVGRLVK